MARIGVGKLLSLLTFFAAAKKVSPAPDRGRANKPKTKQVPWKRINIKRRKHPHPKRQRQLWYKIFEPYVQIFPRMQPGGCSRLRERNAGRPALRSTVGSSYLLRPETLAMICIGPLQVDLARREIALDGQPVRLGSRAFDILAVLIAADGALVSKNDMLRLVWPDTIVEENNLQVHMSALRKVLGESRALIQTVSGRGYRLVLPGSPAAAAEDDQLGTKKTPGSPDRPQQLAVQCVRADRTRHGARRHHARARLHPYRDARRRGRHRQDPSRDRGRARPARALSRTVSIWSRSRRRPTQAACSPRSPRPSA